MKRKEVCRLCGSLSELQESHIIPKSIFKLARDKKLNNRFIELHNKKDNVIQDGPKEYLLCENCEGKISRNEKYFKEAIHLNRHETDKAHDGKKLLIKGLDYKRIKLFFLSLLWRASISSKLEFENVCIVSSEEIIRQRILKENPGVNSNFAISAVVPLINNSNAEALNSAFFDLHDKQLGTIHHILIGGILYTILLTHEQIIAASEEFFLQESGNWAMPLIRIYDIPFLWEFIKYHFDR